MHGGVTGDGLPVTGLESAESEVKGEKWKLKGGGEVKGEKWKEEGGYRDGGLTTKELPRYF